MASNVVPYISEIISEILQFLHYSLQHAGRNCSHFIADVFFHVLHCPWSLSYTLLLRNSQRKKSQALRKGDLAGHSVIPSSWDHANWVHLVENSVRVLRSASFCPILLKPDSLNFNTKYLRFQKCVKHLDLVGWISRYCFLCLVFKEIRADKSKICYTTPNNTFSECKGSWRTSRAVSVAQYRQYWELAQLERLKFASSVMRTWLMMSLPGAFKRFSQKVSIYSVLIFECLSHNHLVRSRM